MHDTSPLRILFVEVGHESFGAEFRVHQQLIDVLTKRGALEAMSLSHPDLVASRPQDTYRVACDAYELDGSKVRRKLSPLTDLPMAIRRALPAIREFRPDVVYGAQARRDALAGHVVSAVTRVPHIVHLHYSFGPWLGRAAVRTIRRARHVITVSEYVRQTTLLRGIPEDRVTTVPNLVDPSPMTGSDRAATRAELDIGEEDVVIIAVGRIDRSKGLVELVRAVADLGDRLEHVHVLICGTPNHDPGHDREVQQVVTDLGLDRVVRLLGQRSDVPALLAASDVFCLPSTMDPFALVYIEAMRAGLPVVALRSGGVPELVVEGSTGLLSYPGDHDALIANLATLVDRPDLRRQYGAAGIARLAADFDHETIANRWLTIVAGAVGRR